MTSPVTIHKEVKKALVNKGYSVDYTENSGMIFGMDLLTKPLPGGNTVHVRVLARNLSMDIRDVRHETIHRAEFSDLQVRPDIIDAILGYISTMEAIHDR